MMISDITMLYDLLFELEMGGTSVFWSRSRPGPSQKKILVPVPVKKKNLVPVMVPVRKNLLIPDQKTFLILVSRLMIHLLVENSI